MWQLRNEASKVKKAEQMLAAQPPDSEPDNQLQQLIVSLEAELARERRSNDLLQQLLSDGQQRWEVGECRRTVVLSGCRWAAEWLLGADGQL